MAAMHPSGQQSAAAPRPMAGGWATAPVAGPWVSAVTLSSHGTSIPAVIGDRREGVAQSEPRRQDLRSLRRSASSSRLPRVTPESTTVTLGLRPAVAVILGL